MPNGATLHPVDRAWPFEDVPEGGRPRPQRAVSPSEFVADPAGAAAIVVRIGRGGAELVVVDADGDWKRWVYPSVEDAAAAARDLGVDVTIGHFPEPVRVRMNARRRRRSEFDSGPYPEQGAVGAVTAYRENRPRRADETPDREGR